ncbi:MAG: GAF domain-containing protein, partial [Vicinamibacterales bacterium]
AWVASNAWTFDLSFAIALAANLLIVFEGVRRYRANRDANERRRIQIVVYTGVCAVLAYTINNVLPVLSAFAGRPVRLPWLVEGALQALIVLPALALPYAVAVRHVFSPRTVLRQGLQYALARRTLSILIALPVAALVFALVSNRDQPLGAIIVGQPLFYAVVVGLAGFGFRYRDAAQRWLDQRFFRAEYDGREILVALANRVPYETDQAELVSLVLAQIDNALHPESLAVLAGDDDQLEVISAPQGKVGALSRAGALATLLRWSEQPLEVFLDDERSPAARLPAVDRAWLAASGLSLLVPILAGSGEQRALAGLIGLGQKRSEEPYTPEDRRLLSAIAAQMSVALDLSRLRRRLSTDGRQSVALDERPSASSVPLGA